jgi:glycosyltransferase involved in cell wall biosynthesis
VKIAILTADSREHFHDYENPAPYFGTAPEALLQGFAKMPEVEVHVVSCVRQPVRSPEKIASNIFYHSLHVPKTGWMRTLYQGCIRATRKKLREIQPDIVHGQGTEHNNALCAVFSGFPNVITIHGNMAELARVFKARVGSFCWLAAKLETFTLKKTGGVFCNSAYTENLVAPRTRRTWRVANPVRAEFFETPTTHASHKKPILMNIGVISQRKQQVKILEMAKKLWRRGLRFEIQFVGVVEAHDNYGATFLRELTEAQKAGYARHFNSLQVGGLVATMDEASAEIHFPMEEAFGLVVAEALARNLKFFGARIGGIPDIAENVEDAELFSKEDWAGLENSIAKWIEVGYSRPTSAAETMCARYSPDIIARRHLEIYREVLNTRS